VVAASALALAACSSGDSGGSGTGTGAATGGGTTPITVGVIPIVDVAPIYLGVKQGFFSDEGLDVKLETASGGAAIVPAVTSGQYQFGFSNSTSLILATSSGLKLKAVTEGVSTTGVDGKDFGGVIVPAGSAIKSAKDLEGKTVAVNTLNNINTTTINKAVRDAGGDPSKVKYTELGFPDIVAAVKKGDVDAGQVVEPFLTQAEGQGMTDILSNYVATDPDLTISMYFTLWTTAPGGIPGNDDAGTMSSWYVWSALGMYPQNPTRADLVLTAPLFPRAVVHTGSGKDITINAPDASASATYITNLKVKGAPSNRPWVPATVATGGGELDYTLSSTPDTSWGAAAHDAPPSFRDGEIPAFVRATDPSVKVEPGTSATTSLKLSTMTGQRVQVAWSVAGADGLTVSPTKSTVTVPSSGSVTADVTVTAAKDAEPGVYTLPVTATAKDGTRITAAPITVTVGTKGTLSWYVNNRGISASDDDPKANFDGEGWSYSAAALAAAGATPGATVSANGFDFVWPDVAPGSPDNVVAGGGDQVLDLSATSQGATKLSFLGSASEGQASGTVTLTYTDGTKQQATLGFSDWTLGGGGGTPQFGNVIALKTAYRDQAGQGKDPVVTDIFASAPIALQAGKQLQSVTLPATVSGGDLHVFAVATA
jgi:ABC-type phosphate/phosphonate transport system substrate-binding protein